MTPQLSKLEQFICKDNQGKNAWTYIDCSLYDVDDEDFDLEGYMENYITSAFCLKFSKNFISDRQNINIAFENQREWDNEMMETIENFRKQKKVIEKKWEN